MIKIVWEPEWNRAGAYDLDEPVGECSVSKPGEYWVIHHTGVDERYGGKGIAAELVKEVVEQARLAGVKIMPLCSYAEREFSKHPEYADVLFEANR